MNEQQHNHSLGWSRRGRRVWWTFECERCGMHWEATSRRERAATSGTTRRCATTPWTHSSRRCGPFHEQRERDVMAWQQQYRYDFSTGDPVDTP